MSPIALHCFRVAIIQDEEAWRMHEAYMVNRKAFRIEQDKVLFLCYGNACRSIMAEALGRHFCGNEMETRSAGFFPLGHIPPFTFEVLEEAGISTDGLYSKGLSEAGIDDIDYLVNLTELRVTPLILHGFSGKLISCPVRDPFGQNIELYREVREELEWLVREKLPELIAAQKKGRG